MTGPLPEDVAHLLSDRPGVVWLDGGRGPSGWSILAWDPVEAVTSPTGWPAAGRALSRSGQAGPAPFDGGVIGFLGYGAGAAVEAVPADGPTPEPPLWLGRYEGGACYHHPTGRWHLTGTPSFRRTAARLLERARPAAPPPPPAPTRGRTIPRGAYEAAVRRALAWIAAGDCYQINLSRPIHVDGPLDPWAAYRRVRRASDARFGAWLHLPDGVVVASNSPELAVRVEGGLAVAAPIKGTRPRHPDPRVDAALRADLEASAKERAELTMIVDLLRNDLGRVAVPGTVAAGTRRIVGHARVHHASAPIRADLLPGVDAWDVLAALLPYGSVTGAPKIRACERIAALEGEPRGAYCGVIGFVADGGPARWSVAIRTAVFAGGRARTHVGGGIVAESEPGAEWRETVAKAAPWAEALGLTRPCAVRPRPRPPTR